jgi:hypothetical protein
MKNSSFLPKIILFTTVLIIVGTLIYLRTNSNEIINDKKSQLTLLNTAKKVPGLKTIIAKQLEKQQQKQQQKQQEKQGNKQENLSDNSQSQTPDLITAERLYTEQELQNMTQLQFSDLLKETEKKLPKLSDIKQLPPGALHHTPVLIIQAGRDLGVIKEVLKSHGSYTKLAVPFYQNCAKDEEGTTPVRAMCLTNLIAIKKNNKESLNLAEYPQRLIELSKMVTDI